MTDVTQPYLDLRRQLLREGRPTPLQVLPTDRARYGLGPWAGMFLGMVCVPSPLVTRGAA